ncbi:MAG: hypothetical protein WC820_11340, partial [Spirochaetales bacterium]
MRIRAAKGKAMHGEHTVISKRKLSEEVYRMEIEAPLVARERRAGQFVIVQCDEDYSERIPLTIADADPIAGTVT